MPTITVEHLVALAQVLQISPNGLLGIEPLQEEGMNEQGSEHQAAVVA